MSKPTTIFFCLLLSFSISGCAIYYRDAETNAEHIFGFGHLAIKQSTPEEGKQAIFTQKTLTGFAIGLDDNNFGFSVGWDQRERVSIYDENTSISIQKPDNGNFFLFKFGSQLPNLIQSTPSIFGEQP